MSQTLTVRGMGCAGCESAVEAALSELPGCTGVVADHEAETVTVNGDIDDDALSAALEASGYSVEA